MIWFILLNTIFSSIMSGIIWFVQVVHYPLFKSLGKKNFIDYQSKHVKLTGNLVGPFMLMELIVSIYVAFWNTHNELAYLIWTNLGLLILIWLSTFFIQVPLHNRLLEGFDHTVHCSLVRGNWIRTYAWTVKMVLSLLLAVRYHDLYGF
jgi:hypothetical protein